MVYPNALDIFSNIGGHALGFEAAGVQTVGFCEIDAGRRELLRASFPTVPIADDVRAYKGRPGIAQILIGGPPCKHTSVSAAITGSRTGETLWPEMLRIGDEMDTEWFVVEQPPGNAAWEAQVADGLAGIGYHSARVEFSAADLGAPHIRRRVFILAHRCLARLALAWQAVPSAIEYVAGLGVDGNPWMQGPPDTVRVDDGLPAWVDRKAAISAIGDSNPPAAAFVIGRAIVQTQDVGLCV
jgi:DNA (cytosine-5)-methyltransferase 1